MIRQDYELIASILYNEILPGERLEIAKAFAKPLKELNPRFDEIKFIKMTTTGSY